MRENLKKKKKRKKIIDIKKVIESEYTLMNKAERSSNYFSNTFTHNQVEQIRKGVICVQTSICSYARPHSIVRFGD